MKIDSAVSDIKNSISDTATVVVSSVVNALTIEKDKYRDHNVYVMKNKSENVEYVGRTIDPKRRQTQHKADPTKAHLRPLQVIATGLTKEEARVMELTIISAYALDNLLNARREIAVGNVAGFSAHINNTMTLYRNLAEDEILNLMEGR